jgi:hypothetical protein
MSETDSADFDFRHHLYDTLILLGAPRDIAGLLKKSLDSGLAEFDIDELRKYNIALIENAKERLTRINKLRIQPSTE